MEFVIQENLNANAKEILAALLEEGIPHKKVRVIPFSDDYIADWEEDGIDYIPYGSTTFIINAHRKGWTGNCWIPDAFTCKNYNLNHPDMLNNEEVVSVNEAITFLQGQKETSTWFIRPNDDLKQFSGTVLFAKDIVDWLKDMQQYDDNSSYSILGNDLILLSTPKDIKAEWRHFIINGKIVSSALYRDNGVSVKIIETDRKILSIANFLTEKWLPHKHCVMDIALTDTGFFVLEFNTINASGFYGHDIGLIFYKWKRSYD